MSLATLPWSPYHAIRKVTNLQNCQVANYYCWFQIRSFQGTRKGVPLTVYLWYFLCSLGILGDYNPSIPTIYGSYICQLVQGFFPRPYQQTPGGYPKPPTNSLWFGIPEPFEGERGCLGYAKQGNVGFPLDSYINIGFGGFIIFFWCSPPVGEVSIHFV